ncbi:hypothetical protein BpHYR1_024622 [Brachionus plicatilis]|uniref:Uncharacterized protein n=1 Tax=Brachionus plicatilis TaxID=10195 RepID=A0A3M7SRB6_BRAPC|nr:hypothetical protein BpHYR1_024622 [Brachionus plicatilis]
MIYLMLVKITINIIFKSKFLMCSLYHVQNNETVFKKINLIKIQDNFWFNEIEVANLKFITLLIRVIPGQDKIVGSDKNPFFILT